MRIGLTAGMIFAAVLAAGALQAKAAEALRMTRGPSGEVGLSFPTRPDLGYILETSDNGTNWVVLREGEGSGAVFGVEDWVAPVLPRRFYRLRHVTTPEHDFFARPLALEGGKKSLKTWNFFATRELGEPKHSESLAASRTIWFKWKAPANGHAFIDTMGSFFETALAVYQGTQLSGLKVVTQGYGSARMLAFDAQKDQEYWLAVGSAENRAGVVHLNLDLFTDQVSTEVQDGVYYLWVSEGKKHRLVMGKNDWALFTTNEPVASGRVLGAEQLGDLLVYNLENAGKKLTWKMHMKKGRSGEFTQLEGDRQLLRGKIQRLYRQGEPFALDELFGVRLAGTRLWTTTGTSGQTHYYTFSADGRFHDTDNDEQASGRYLYQRLSETTARLLLTYEGPGDFTGDQHDILLTFASPVRGEFTSDYIRNDGVKIVVKGRFDLLE